MYANWGNIIEQREHVKDIQRAAAMHRLADQARGDKPRGRSYHRPPLAALAYGLLLSLHAVSKVLRG